ncbi:MAG: hypothetical protein ACE5KM_05990 [Planctomycetaceae bacterium]
MIDEQEVTLDGQTYFWNFNPDRPNEKPWSWRTADNAMPPTGLQPRLNRAFLKQKATAVVETLTDSHREKLLPVLQRMGAKESELEAAGLQPQLKLADRSYQERSAFRDLPEPGHTPFNCPTLRNWFFSEGNCESQFLKKLGEAVCVGDGPFAADELSKFLQDRGLPVLDQQEWPGVVVLGRNGYTEEEVDEIIDRREGMSLRIYSQEMLLASVAADKDAFGRFDVPHAFCAGHPGLEFVSQGWRGWVQARVLPDRQSTPKTFDGKFEVDKSPLAVMGYRVGQSGAENSERRRVLTQAFKESLPFVGPSDYMAQWGEPETPHRLRKIAENIAAYRDNAMNQQKDNTLAIEHWEADLSWLKKTFYHGHMRFHWPDTFV